MIECLRKLNRRLCYAAFGIAVAILAIQFCSLAHSETNDAHVDGQICHLCQVYQSLGPPPSKAQASQKLHFVLATPLIPGAIVKATGTVELPPARAPPFLLLD